MANEIVGEYLTGATLYAILYNDAAQQVWNGSAFAAWVNGNYATYPIAMTEMGASGKYFANLPGGLDANAGYSYDVLVQQGGSPAIGDIAYKCSVGQTGAAPLAAVLTESYAADGAAFTLPQALYMIWSLLANAGIVGTTQTSYKVDSVTTAMTFTLNSASFPTQRLRTT